MKRRYRYFAIILILTITMAFLSSCSLFMPPKQKFDGGELLDADKLAEIKEEIFSNKSYSEDATSVQTEKETEAKTECTSEPYETVEIESKTEITSEEDGSVVTETDIESNTATGETERNESLVYWVDGGEVWHTNENCRYIKNKSVVSGTVEDAMAADKTRVCSSCNK